MDRTGKKCVLYLRVSTEMQVDGYSLAGQKTCLTNYAEREQMKVLNIYEDAGKSGKSIDGRPAFKKMISDIKNGLSVDYVIVYKLSRFGRNAADVLNSLETIQENGVNLICTDEGIDSSQASGRLLISVLSAVAQIERENILEQTMNGRREKARQGLWNGGMAPYGYKIVDGKLVINEEEAKTVKYIYDQYVNTPISMRALVLQLNRMNFPRIERGNILGGFWGETSIKRILNNPVYIGKIEWGHRKNTKVKGSKEMKRVYTNDNIIISDGAHEPIIDIDTWDKAQSKRNSAALTFKGMNRNKQIHPLSGLLHCPKCGAPMRISANVSRLSGGERHTLYKYRCESYRKKAFDSSITCDYTVSYPEDKLEILLKKALNSTLASPVFIDSLKKEFSNGENDDKYKQQLEAYNKKIKSLNLNKTNIENRIDGLEYDDPKYEDKYRDLNDRLDKAYEDIYEIEVLIDDVRNKLNAYNSELISADLIVSILSNFTKFYDLMNNEEKRQMLKLLIKRIVPKVINPDDNYFTLDRIEFNFPIFKDINIVNQIKVNQDDKFDYSSLPNELVLSKCNKTIEYGDEENQISIEPEEYYRYENKIDFIIQSNQNRNDVILKPNSNEAIIKYVKEKYQLVVYGPLIRKVKKLLGIRVKVINNNCNELNRHKLSVEKYDAICDAIKELGFIPIGMKDTFDDVVLEKREIVIKESKKEDKKKEYIDIIKDVKEKHQMIITANNIETVLCIIGKKEDYKIGYLPKIDKSLIILDSLINKKWIDVNDSYKDVINDYYEKYKASKTRKTRINNDMIIDSVKEKYKLTVNSSMISYVRDKLGICVKKKDRRYDPTQKNKRIPSPEQYKAIVDVMNQYNSI